MSDHALRVDTSNSRIIKKHLTYETKSLDGIRTGKTMQ